MSKFILEIVSKIPDIYYLQAEFCRSIDHPKRLMIIDCLSQHEMTVGELAEMLGTSLPNVSQHLKVLTDKGILTRRKEGNRVIYSLRYPEIKEAFSIVQTILRRALKDDLQRASTDS